MGFKDWAKRVQKEISISKEEIAAGAIIAAQDSITVEATFVSENRKMTKKMHDQLVEQDRKYGRGPGIVIPAKFIKVQVLQEPIHKYHILANSFNDKLVYTETRIQAKAVLITANAQWKATKAAVQKFTKEDFVELVFENGTKMLDKPDRLVVVLDMDINNANATLAKIDSYKIQQARRGAAKHVDLSFGSLKNRWKKRR